MYTKCLGLLRENGLIERTDGHYKLSHDLFAALEKVLDRWGDLVRSVERGERIKLG